MAFEKFPWNRDTIIHLIKLYKNKPSLYNPRHADYKNKSARDAALSHLREEMLKLDYCKNQECLMVDHIRMKLRSLRTQYCRDLKKKLQKSQPGKGYRPSLWCYDKLDFLQTFCFESSPSLTGMLEDSVPKIEWEDDDDDYSEVTIQEEETDPLNDNDNLSVNSEHPNKKQRVSELSSEDNKHEDPDLCGTTLSDFSQHSAVKNEARDDVNQFAKLVESEILKIHKPRILRKLKIDILQMIYVAQEEDEES